MHPLFVFASGKAPRRAAGAPGATGAPIACAGCSIAPRAAASSSAPTVPHDRPVEALSPRAVSACLPYIFGAPRAALTSSIGIGVDPMALDPGARPARPTAAAAAPAARSLENGSHSHQQMRITRVCECESLAFSPANDTHSQ